MRRSEMRAKIALCIARQAIESGNVDIPLSWLSTDEVLQCMEDAGMLPPKTYLAYIGVVDNMWEEE